jgi:UDP-N-acetylmuramate dehydrogenase
MLVWMLTKLNQDPSYIVGGVLNQFACNAHAGTGQYFVIEADEYDNMFLGLSPTIGIVTNIEHDHPDFFPTEKDYLDAFQAFVERIQPNGLALLCIDDPLTQKLTDVFTKTGIRVLTYGVSPQANYQADQIHLDGVQHRFSLNKRDEDGRILELGSQTLVLPGKHNVLNATAALAVIDQLGLPMDKAMSALQSFTGTQRRFEVLGEADGITIIDDYGHHPTQLMVTLKAAQQRYPGKRIWAVWQPHTYTRTLALADDFTRALKLADRVLVLPVYAAREKNPGYSAEQFIAKLPQGQAAFSQNLQSAAQTLLKTLQPDDVVIFFSAGDAVELSQAVMSALKRKTNVDQAANNPSKSILFDELRAVFGTKMHENVKMANFTTARVGGPVPALITIFTLEELTMAAQLLWRNSTPFIVLGSGSNILVSDEGLDAVVLHNRAHNVKIDTASEVPTIYAESGAILSTVARQSALRGLSGLEWAAPVPGTVGGAVYGNAGAHGADMAVNLKMAEILHKINGIENWPVEKLAYQYRSSLLKREKIPCVILSGTFSMVRSSREEAWEKINAFQTRRRETQPSGASMGSVFKNPSGDYAGRLIEDAGLKGRRVGRAMISPQHANFIINLEGATAQDIWHLIKIAKETVKDKFGINLEPEIEMLGDFH